MSKLKPGQGVAFMMQGLLLLYRIFRPFFMIHSGLTCRFTPTCSLYCAQAFTRFGVLKGGRLAFKRLIKCHPWGGEGIDFCDQPDRLRQDLSIGKR